MDAQIQVIQTLAAQGNLLEALTQIQQLPLDIQQSPLICSMLGIINLSLERYDDAEVFLKSACHMEPDCPDNWFNLAYLYTMTNQLQSFSEVCRTLEQLDYGSDYLDQLDDWKKLLYQQRPVKHVLMIAFYYPPLSGSGVFRSLKFSKYLPLYGWLPTVISAAAPPDFWNYRDYSQLDEVPDCAEVVRLEDPIDSIQPNDDKCTDLVNRVLIFLRSVLANDPSLLHMFDATLKNSSVSWKLLQFPDAALFWVYQAACYISQDLDMSQFDVVYTSSAPFSSSLLGLHLKRTCHIPWVADYRDQISFNPYFPTTDPTYQYLEKFLLQSADLNIINAASLVQDYAATFSLDRSRILSISNGYDEQDFASLSPRLKKTDVFTITHSGLLYANDPRNFNSLFQALSELIAEGKMDKKRLCIRIIGSFPADVPKIAESFHLAECLSCSQQYISHHDALQANLDSDLLYLLAGDEDRFVNVYTGKIYDYLRSGRQILALAPPGNVLGPIFDRIGYGHLVQSFHLEQFKQYLLEEYRAWEQSSGPIHYYHPYIRHFERSHLTGQLADALERTSLGRAEHDGSADRQPGHP